MNALLLHLIIKNDFNHPKIFYIKFLINYFPFYNFFPIIPNKSFLYKKYIHYLYAFDKIFSSNQPVAPSEVKDAIDFIKDTLESRLSELEASDEIKKQIKERENNKINALEITIVSTLEGQNRLHKL